MVTNGDGIKKTLQTERQLPKWASSAEVFDEARRLANAEFPQPSPTAQVFVILRRWF
jgi:hypothetical protein